MGQSSVRLPDTQVPPASRVERRRLARHKLHSPVYVSFSGPQTGTVVDLSELLDLNEYGFSVQTASDSSLLLEANHAVSLCLDLSETKTYVHGNGQVVWRDDTGRVGVRFSYLPDNSRETLREWLFLNLLMGASNQAARAGQLAHHRQQKTEVPEEATAPGAKPPSPALVEPAPSLDRAAMLSALDNLRGEVRTLPDRDAIFSLIVRRACAFTGATGAALAFITGSEMRCRAQSGSPAPPVGSTVDVKEGLTGECVRTGNPVLCEDTASDPRVDAELCRLLGIGSLLAVPIVSDFRVIGVLEALSPAPRAFNQTHITILDRLVELVPKSEPAKTPAPQTSAGQGNAGEAKSAGNAAGASEEKTEIAAPGSPQSPVILAAIPDVYERAASEPSPARPSAAPFSLTEVEEPRSIAEDAFELHTIREALWDHPQEETSFPEAMLEPPEASPAAAAQGEPLGERSGQEPEEEMREDLAAETSARSPIIHFGLLFLALAAVALVLGYLIAPVFERTFGGKILASSSSPERAAANYPGNATGSNAATLSAKGKGPRLTLPELRKLADQGDPEAQWSLGVLYHNGEGVPQNDSQAVELFLRAANHGYLPAQATLGAYYWAGRGVPKDYSKAYFWSRLALAQGDDNMKSRLEGLAAQMTHQQVTEAQQQAEAWLHTHTQAKN